jgi:hypothetical protein
VIVELLDEQLRGRGYGCLEDLFPGPRLAALEAEMKRSGTVARVWYEVLLHLTEAPGNMLRMQDLAAASPHAERH